MMKKIACFLFVQLLIFESAQIVEALSVQPSTMRQRSRSIVHVLTVKLPEKTQPYHSPSPYLPPITIDSPEKPVFFATNFFLKKTALETSKNFDFYLRSIIKVVEFFLSLTLFFLILLFIQHNLDNIFLFSLISSFTLLLFLHKKHIFYKKKSAFFVIILGLTILIFGIFQSTSSLIIVGLAFFCLGTLHLISRNNPSQMINKNLESQNPLYRIYFSPFLAFLLRLFLANLFATVGTIIISYAVLYTVIYFFKKCRRACPAIFLETLGLFLGLVLLILSTVFSILPPFFILLSTIPVMMGLFLTLPSSHCLSKQKHISNLYFEKFFTTVFVMGSLLWGCLYPSQLPFIFLTVILTAGICGLIYCSKIPKKNCNISLCLFFFLGGATFALGAFYATNILPFCGLFVMGFTSSLIIKIHSDPFEKNSPTPFVFKEYTNFLLPFLFSPLFFAILVWSLSSNFFPTLLSLLGTAVFAITLYLIKNTLREKPKAIFLISSILLGISVIALLSSFFLFPTQSYLFFLPLLILTPICLKNYLVKIWLTARRTNHIELNGVEPLFLYLSVELSFAFTYCIYIFSLSTQIIPLILSIFFLSLSLLFLFQHSCYPLQNNSLPVFTENTQNLDRTPKKNRTPSLQNILEKLLAKSEKSSIIWKTIHILLSLICLFSFFFIFNTYSLFALFPISLIIFSLVFVKYLPSFQGKISLSLISLGFTAFLCLFFWNIPLFYLMGSSFVSSGILMALDTNTNNDFQKIDSKRIFEYLYQIILWAFLFFTITQWSNLTGIIVLLSLSFFEIEIFCLKKFQKSESFQNTTLLFTAIGIEVFLCLSIFLWHLISTHYIFLAILPILIAVGIVLHNNSSSETEKTSISWDLVKICAHLFIFSAIFLALHPSLCAIVFFPIILIIALSHGILYQKSKKRQNQISLLLLTLGLLSLIITFFHSVEQLALCGLLLIGLGLYSLSLQRSDIGEELPPLKKNIFHTQLLQSVYVSLIVAGFLWGIYFHLFINTIVSFTLLFIFFGLDHFFLAPSHNNTLPNVRKKISKIFFFIAINFFILSPFLLFFFSNPLYFYISISVSGTFFLFYSKNLSTKEQPLSFSFQDKLLSFVPFKTTALLLFSFLLLGIFIFWSFHFALSSRISSLLTTLFIEFILITLIFVHLHPEKSGIERENSSSKQKFLWKFLATLLLQITFCCFAFMSNRHLNLFLYLSVLLFFLFVFSSSRKVYQTNAHLYISILSSLIFVLLSFLPHSHGSPLFFLTISVFSLFMFCVRDKTLEKKTQSFQTLSFMIMLGMITPLALEVPALCFFAVLLCATLFLIALPLTHIFSKKGLYVLNTLLICIPLLSIIFSIVGWISYLYTPLSLLVLLPIFSKTNSSYLPNELDELSNFFYANKKLIKHFCLLLIIPSLLWGIFLLEHFSIFFPIIVLSLFLIYVIFVIVKKDLLRKILLSSFCLLGLTLVLWGLFVYSIVFELAGMFVFGVAALFLSECHSNFDCHSHDWRPQYLIFKNIFFYSNVALLISLLQINPIGTVFLLCLTFLFVFFVRSLQKRNTNLIILLLSVLMLSSIVLFSVFLTAHFYNPFFVDMGLFLFITVMSLFFSQNIGKWSQNKNYSRFNKVIEGIILGAFMAFFFFIFLSKSSLLGSTSLIIVTLSCFGICWVLFFFEKELSIPIIDFFKSLSFFQSNKIFLDCFQFFALCILLFSVFFLVENGSPYIVVPLFLFIFSSTVLSFFFEKKHKPTILLCVFFSGTLALIFFLIYASSSEILFIHSGLCLLSTAICLWIKTQKDNAIPIFHPRTNSFEESSNDIVESETPEDKSQTQKFVKIVHNILSKKINLFDFFIIGLIIPLSINFPIHCLALFSILPLLLCFSQYLTENNHKKINNLMALLLSLSSITLFILSFFLIPQFFAYFSIPLLLVAISIYTRSFLKKNTFSQHDLKDSFFSLSILCGCIGFVLLSPIEQSFTVLLPIVITASLILFFAHLSKNNKLKNIAPLSLILMGLLLSFLGFPIQISMILFGISCSFLKNSNLTIDKFSTPHNSFFKTVSLVLHHFFLAVILSAICANPPITYAFTFVVLLFSFFNAFILHHQSKFSKSSVYRKIFLPLLSGLLIVFSLSITSLYFILQLPLSAPFLQLSVGTILFSCIIILECLRLNQKDIVSNELYNFSHWTIIIETLIIVLCCFTFLSPVYIFIEIPILLFFFLVYICVSRYIQVKSIIRLNRPMYNQLELIPDFSTSSETFLQTNAVIAFTIPSSSLEKLTMNELFHYTKILLNESNTTSPEFLGWIARLKNTLDKEKKSKTFILKCTRSLLKSHIYDYISTKTTVVISYPFIFDFFKSLDLTLEEKKIDKNDSKLVYENFEKLIPLFLMKYGAIDSFSAHCTDISPQMYSDSPNLFDNMTIYKNILHSV